MRQKLDYSRYFKSNQMYAVETDKGTIKGFYNSLSSTHEQVCIVTSDGCGQHVIQAEDITQVYEVENWKFIGRGIVCKNGRTMPGLTLPWNGMI